MLEGESFHEGGQNVAHKRSCLVENRVDINKAWSQLQKYCNTSYYVEYCTFEFLYLPEYSIKQLFDKDS